MNINFLAFPVLLDIPASDKIAVCAAVVAIGSVIVSVYTYFRSERLSKAAFNRTFRPYVFASSMLTEERDNMRILNYHVLNAPASIKNKNISFYIRRSGMKDTSYYDHPGQENIIMFPSDNDTIEYVPDFTINHDVAERLTPALLVRKVRIDYGWISDNMVTYFFESECTYNTGSHTWDVIYETAN